MYKKYFLSFADKTFHKSLERIRCQAIDMNYYDEVITWDEGNLDEDFREHFKQRLSIYVRGFGYWVWKPQAILQTLRKMSDGDVLQYTDAGCHLNQKGVARLTAYFEASHKKDIVTFQEEPRRYSPDWQGDGKMMNYIWTKGDLLDYFDVRDNKEVTHLGSCWSGSLFVKKSPFSVSIIEEWIKVFYDDFSLVTDKPSKSNNIDGFIGHCHYQAVWSILCIKYKINTFSINETWIDAKIDADWDALKEYPIWAKRDKEQEISFYARVKRKIYRIASRF